MSSRSDARVSFIYVMCRGGCSEASYKTKRSIKKKQSTNNEERSTSRYIVCRARGQQEKIIVCRRLLRFWGPVGGGIDCLFLFSVISGSPHKIAKSPRCRREPLSLNGVPRCTNSERACITIVLSAAFYPCPFWWCIFSTVKTKEMRFIEHLPCLA